MTEITLKTSIFEPTSAFVNFPAPTVKQGLISLWSRVQIPPLLPVDNEGVMKIPILTEIKTALLYSFCIPS